MNVKRIIIAGLAVAIFEALYGMLTCGWLFNWVYQLPPTVIWRDMTAVTGNYWALVNVGQLIIAIIYATVYAKTEILFAGGKLRKGVLFGLAFWFVTYLPGTFYMYAFMNMASGAAIYMLIRGFFGNLVMGLLFATIYRRNLV